MQEDIPPLFPYQETGAAWLADPRNRRAGLWDEPGLGKSAQAIRALDHAKVRNFVLVVCPAAVRQVWVSEFRTFGLIPRRVLKGKGVHDLKLWQSGKVDVLVVSYEFASQHFERLGGDFITAIIFDEAHYLKNINSNRTMRLLGPHADGRGALARWGARVWFLTGTPNPNDAADLWSMLRFIGATTLAQDAFRARYYYSKQGAYSTAHEPRPERLAELHQVIRSAALRRLESDVAKDRPPLTFAPPLELDGDSREVRAMLAEFPGLDQIILAAAESGSLGALDVETAGHVATLRRLLGEAKAVPYADLLVEEIKNGRGKVITFGIHRKALDIVHGALEAAGIYTVRLDGETSERQRVEAVRAFQHDPDCLSFLGNIKAAGTGQTLTASHNVDMLERAWAPADNFQAVKRAHRTGQTKPVVARFVSLANSFDGVVTAVERRKAAAIARVEGD